ncbi:hypothetical protein MTR_7g075545 [Medicago truncatula]|uniref:Uncharacterized protein n=1 Tax=Medicago truncatula TaxID=3880 RepID=A0A072U2A8_MEDTR|nr:hypothetical protein MTR_7g075545 [Medicago truncatula]
MRLLKESSPPSFFTPNSTVDDSCAIPLFSLRLVLTSHSSASTPFCPFRFRIERLLIWAVYPGDGVVVSLPCTTWIVPRNVLKERPGRDLTR